MDLQNDFKLRVDRTQKEYLNTTLAFISRNARSILRLLFVLPAPVLLASTFLSLYLFRDLFFSSLDLGNILGKNSLINFSFYAGLVATGIVSYAPVWLLVATLQTFLYLYVNEGSAGLTPARVLAEMRSQWKVLFSSFLAQTGILLVAGMLFLLGVGLLLSQANELLGLGLIGVGIVPLIYLMAVVAFLSLMRMQEGISLGVGLKRCFNLHYLNFNRSAGLLLATVFVALIFGVAFQLPMLAVSIAGQTAGLKAELGDTYTALFLLLVGLAIFAQLLLMTLPAVAMGFRYYGLVEHQESFGLRERIQLIGKPLEE